MALPGKLIEMLKVAVREGLARLLTSIIFKPPLLSATKAVLLSAERVTS